MPAVKILLYAYVKDLRYLLDAVEVEVIDRLAIAIGIFVDQWEGGGGDDILDAQFLADGFDEGGLAYPHVSVDGKDFGVAHGVEEVAGGLVDLVEAFEFKIHFLHIAFPFLVFVYYRLRGVRVMRGTIISSIEMPPCWNVSL